jgi:hypothetical protein
MPNPWQKSWNTLVSSIPGKHGESRVRAIPSQKRILTMASSLRCCIEKPKGAPR